MEYLTTMIQYIKESVKKKKKKDLSKKEKNNYQLSTYIKLMLAKD